MTQNDPFSDPFSSGGTLPETLPEHPWGLFKDWWDEAHTGDEGKPIESHPNAMALATLGESGMPSSRIVYCKGMDLSAGWICFYTNYNGRKARQLAANPKAAAGFHWNILHRQACIEGHVVKSPPEQSDAYFASRALISRLGAWASHQSEPVNSREELLIQYADVMERFGIGADTILNDIEGRSITIPRPDHWGGYRIWASRVELWIGGKGRFHDRAVWTRDLAPNDDEFKASPWQATRLQP